jgi:hypothetical protein
MTVKRMLAIALALVVGASLIAGTATAAKKKGPKPYKSEEGMVAIPHTLLRASSGQQNSITIQEFENRCAVPASNGLDAYVFEVPEDYRKIDATITTHATATYYDLYALFYDESCKLGAYALEASGSTGLSTEAPYGTMPAGTAYVVIADFLGDPATVSFDLKPLK